ncbi:T9SS type B sorting domain-containing protein [Urechidicola vernalis]|uniref:T9SS type B sorting domain-containing protein n=1 Tax=Urechidicola vernalis TaxID=3075600 RepID=A0ABU2Y8E1_9FLAO|nr:T9SS type B sorting domain-containing protein [Urechidicola sp. P050]MDT0554307.1 T9SS type B sorting domain-containing protein [Urechidicola sp. P050]
MTSTRFTVLFSIVFFLVAFIQVNGQLSKTHYIPPLTSAEFGNANPEDQYIYLSTPSAANITYTIIPIGEPATNHITGIVSNTSPQEIYIGNGSSQLFMPSSTTSTVTNNKGYIVEAEDVIYVSVRMEAGGGAQAGALVSKGLTALGTTFRVGSFTNENAGTNYLNFVSVMATEDNTVVSFSDLPTGISIKNYTGTTPISITLNEGESYILATNSSENSVNRDGLIGTLVTSDKNIVVNCGSANGSFHNGGGRDYGIDQIVDLSKVGNEYIFVRGDGSDNWENVLIVAHSDNTTININGVSTGITLNAGDYHLIEGNEYNSLGNMYVETSEPVFAYQGLGGSGEANQGMFFVPPLSCETRGNLDNIAQIESIGNTIYSGGLSIVTKTGATVTINNNPISSYASVGPSSVTGNSDYITYKVSGLSGNISVQSDDELYCAYYNYNGFATSGSFYSGFPTPPEINFDAAFVSLGICIPNITLSVANAANFDSFEWYYDDGTGYVATGINTVDYTPTQSGTYKLIGILTCSNLTLESLAVPVSICPDDIDNDGIIDNIDMDNDNDGILNCQESNGDQNINLSNINGGSIPIGGYTYTGTVTTIGNASSTPFKGATDGGFLSEIPSKNGTPTSSLNYDLVFNQNLNLRFEQATSTSLGSGLLTNDEEFVIQVPNTRTVTLLDPDDQLLVDTNYDGVFETGVTQVSSFEIRFKLKDASLPIGSGTFSFLADSIDRFNYTHINNSETSTNQAAFKITATCVKLDSDSDGIEDSLDYDSDNDGITDLIENQGLLLNLSNTDIDNNGLDDVFDINGIPIDSDTDGVLDYLDLDSDNDGIYDIEESVGNALDSDFDGVIDGSNATTVGSNGLEDSLETSPDSGIINYTVLDTDTDTILNYLDLDSDGDNCFDTFEAGFSDVNNDGLLGDVTITVNTKGIVTSASNGYTIPNADYLIFAPILIELQPINTEVCELSNAIITINSSTADSYQWETTTDGINWTPLINDALYSGVQSNTLTIGASPLMLNTSKYRVLLVRAGNSCNLYSDEIELSVIKLPIAATPSDMILCDDDNNGTMPFILSNQNGVINADPTMSITYHSSQNDADLNLNPISGPYESGNAIIYARVENTLNTTCFDTTSFNLQVFESPFPLDSSSISNLGKCDNNSVGNDTDGIIIFDLTQKETEILNGQSSTNFNLRYFTDSNLTVASEILTPTSFQNSVRNLQTIYVIVSNNLEPSCYTDTSFQVEVFELPNVSTPNLYAQCDDASNDGIASFNLELPSIKEEINPNYISENLTFTFYNSLVDAKNGINQITNSASYINTNPFVTEVVWIRIENPNGCYRTETISLEVNPSSAALSNYNPAPMYKCDDGTNIRDGISTFDLSPIQNHISNTIFSTFNVSVHFFESLLDAELETNEITNISTHQNTNAPTAQSIWVRVKSDLGNNCLGLQEFTNLINVEALPFATLINEYKECDNDQDGVFLFNTSTLENDILNGQDPSTITINYFDASGNPLTDNIGTGINSPFPNSFLTVSQTVHYTLTNNSTNDPNGACTDSNTVQFTVDLLPINNTVIISPICDPNPDDGLLLAQFDTSNLETTIGAQSGMEINYFDAAMNPLFDLNGNAITSPFPSNFTTEPQTINVVVTNPANRTCPVTNSIDFIIDELPEFSVDSTRIICESGPNSTITLDVYQDDPSEVLEYEWTDENGAFVSNATSIDISTSGTYTVTLTKTNGSGCSRSKEIYAVYSEQAKIDYDDITIVDDSDNNTITISTENENLGKGDYEYSLDDSYGPYQDEPFFDFVMPGIHTIYINDKNGCGISEIEVSVIGYPKFFTPNDDGHNDTWQVLGIDQNFYSASIIYIYDRFGKIITKLNSNQQGWDGYYNGVKLPADDYWFSAQLIDKNGEVRSRKGHFSLIRR